LRYSNYMKLKFVISQNEFKGPFNLSLTIGSGQTSQPAWLEKAGYFQELVNVDAKPCLVKIEKSDEVDGPLKVVSETPLKIKRESIKAKVMEIFGLKDNLNQLYDFLRENPRLEPSIDFCRGLRIFKAHDPFECVISSISSANCSIIRWNRSIMDIKRKWGEKYQFKDGDFYTFPSPQRLSEVPEHELEEMQRHEENLPGNYVFENNLQACGVGYRAKYILKAAQMMQNEIDLDQIAYMKYDDAFETLIHIPGVGPKVADCILLYGFGMGKAFPVDVWIARIISELYFKEEKLKPPKIRSFGMEKFGNNAGYVQLYLFHYARKSGLLEKLAP
jgi:N-glycosylase/DNA lyase